MLGLKNSEYIVSYHYIYQIPLHLLTPVINAIWACYVLLMGP